MNIRLVFLLAFLALTPALQAQTYHELLTVEVEGASYTDADAIKLLSGLRPGETINLRGNAITEAIRKLWKQQLFADVSIDVDRYEGDGVHLIIYVKELPRLRDVFVVGLKPAMKRRMEERFIMHHAGPINRATVERLKNEMLAAMAEDGYCNATITTDTLPTGDPKWRNLRVEIKRGERCVLREVVWEGNQNLDDKKVKRAVGPTLPRSFFRPFAKRTFAATRMEDALAKLRMRYEKEGYQDVALTYSTDTLPDGDGWRATIKIDEGIQYHMGTVTWVGNSVYSSSQLDSILNMPAGSVFDRERFEKRLFMDGESRDVSSFYLDNGYLFFRLEPIVVDLTDNVISYEIRVTEGPQAIIGEVNIEGNTRTNQHVLLREVRTYPGALFRRVDVMRSQRDLVQLGYLDPEKMDIRMEPHPEDGTVDITYIVEEAPNDRVELSGGWGGSQVVGTVGFNFSNFALRNMFRKEGWRPVPAGDGQHFSVRAQSAGSNYYAFNFSFTEPWFRGKRPNPLSISSYYSYRSLGEGETLDLYGLSVSYGTRLNWPDDYSSLNVSLGAQRYVLNNFSLFTLDNGQVNNFFVGGTFRRNSTDNPFFPTEGTSFKLDAKIAPPWSVFSPNTDYAELPDARKFKTLEYGKFKASLSYFKALDKKKKLVFNAKGGIGLLTGWNRDIGTPPFDRFYMGGSGMNLNALEPREQVGLRGYSDGELSSLAGDAAAVKYTAEIRYLLSNHPAARIYVLGFAEAGNTWGSIGNMKAFDLRRSVGAGIRIQTPMFGTIGFDMGYGLDHYDATGGRFKQWNPTVTLGINIGDL